MASNNKILLTYKEFTDKMNECLHRDPGHEGMEFLCDRNGYDLVATDISETDRMALSKTISDEVFKRFAISND